MKNFVKNKNFFNLLTDVKLIITLSTLNKKKYSSHDYSLMKLVFSVDNLNFHLTEYLYQIALDLTTIMSPMEEQDVWSQLILEKKAIAKTTKSISTILKNKW